MFDQVIQTWKRLGKWRTRSFYMLILAPLILLLGAHIGTLKESPGRFAFVLSLLLIFFFLMFLFALRDLVYLATRNTREKSATFRETLGDEAFLRRFTETQAEEDEGNADGERD